MSGHRQRLSETSLRFIILGLAVAGAALVLAESLWYAIHLEGASANALSCVGQPSGDATTLCMLPGERTRVLWTLVVTIGVVVVVMLCAAAGSWVRRRRLSDLPALPPQSAIALSPLAEEGAPPVSILVRLDRPTTAARADGIVRRYIEVGTNWISWTVTNPERARAVINHELAHHRARDVPPTRLSWWSGPVLAVFALAFFALELSNLAAPAILGALVRVTLVVLAVFVARAAVLRAREYDADLAAAASDPRGLLAALTASSTRQTRGLFGPAFRALRTHPTARERQRVLESPSLLARPNTIDALLVGLVATTTGPALSRLWRAWTGTGDGAYWSELPGWGVAGVLVGAWSATVFNRTSDPGAARARQPIRTFTWTLSVGLIVGSFVFSEPVAIAGLPSMDPLSLVLLIGAVLILAVVIRWLHDLARLCCTPGRSASHSVAVVLTGALVLGLVLGIVGSVLNIARSLADAGADDLASAGLDPAALLVVVVTTYLASGPVLVVTLAAVIVTIMLVTLHRRDIFRQAAVFGAVSGLLGVAALVIVTLLLRPAAKSGSLDASTYAALSQSSVVVPVALGAAIAGMVAPDIRIIRTALSAAVGTIVGTAGAAIVLTLSAGGDVASNALVGQGVLVSVPIALLLAGSLAPTDHPRAENELSADEDVTGARGPDAPRRSDITT